MPEGSPETTLPERFRQLLKTLNHSANSFARLVGVNPSQMVKVASGQTKPSLDTLEKISAALPRLNLEWLIGGRGDMLKPLTAPAAPAAGSPVAAGGAPLAAGGATAAVTPAAYAPAAAAPLAAEPAAGYGSLAECQRELHRWQERARMFETLAADRQLIIDLLRQRGPKPGK